MSLGLKLLIGALAAAVVLPLFLTGCDRSIRYGQWDYYLVGAGPLDCRYVDDPHTKWLQCALPGHQRPWP